MDETDLAALTTAMMRASRLVRTARPAGATLPGLEEHHQMLLEELVGQPQRVSELAERQCVELSTVSRRVSRLVSLGLAEKAPSPTDRRVQVVRLTELGRQTHARLHEQRMAVVAQVVGSWERDDREALAQFATRVAQALDEVAQREASSAATDDVPTA